jgi:uncharacterized protein
MESESLVILGIWEVSPAFSARSGNHGGSHLAMSSPRHELADNIGSRLSTQVLEPVETSTSERGSTPRADMETSTIPSGNSRMNIVAESVLRVDTEDLDLQPDPIPDEWILAGTPEARVTKLQTSRDWTSSVVLWECTPGSFKWHYSKDETVFFLAGEAFMTDDNGQEHRFGAGDIVVISAGTNCKWRVTEPIRKVAVVRETIWRPLGFMLKVSKKLFRGEHSELKSDNRPSHNLTRN